MRAGRPKGTIASWGRRRWPHFRPREFGGPVHPDLLDVLERIRSRAGDVPVTIVSGYRDAAKNTAVGGVPRSQHLLGRAADIPAGLVTPDEARMCGAVGVGVSGEWAIHVDVREGPSAQWNY